MGIMRLSKAAKRVGRSKRTFSFQIAQLEANGNPGPGCTGMKVRLWRHDKRYETEELSANGLAGIASAYRVAWSETFSMKATLFESKTGKTFSDKIFQVSLFGRFGNRLTEVARGELNLSRLAVSSEGADAGASNTQSLLLQPRAIAAASP